MSKFYDEAGRRVSAVASRVVDEEPDALAEARRDAEITTASGIIRIDALLRTNFRQDARANAFSVLAMRLDRNETPAIAKALKLTPQATNAIRRKLSRLFGRNI